EAFRMTQDVHPREVDSRGRQAALLRLGVPARAELARDDSVRGGVERVHQPASQIIDSDLRCQTGVRQTVGCAEPERYLTRQAVPDAEGVRTAAQRKHAPRRT